MTYAPTQQTDAIRQRGINSKRLLQVTQQRIQIGVFTLSGSGCVGGFLPDLKVELTRTAVPVPGQKAGTVPAKSSI